jgi:DNA polymerase-3 subunit delta'
LPLLPLYGHSALKARLAERIAASALPQSILLHGPAGVGKQRLALWIAQTLICSGPNPRPCGACRDCRYVLDLNHPDLTWVFPRPRPRDSDADPEDIAEDLAETAAKRAAEGGIYAPPAGTEGIYVATVRYLVGRAVRTPALARRKVFVIGEADRMAQQEGAEVAANAFLKLLEEPPADTNIVITTSAFGSLLPTIRSRVVAIRVPTLDDASVREFLADPQVGPALDRLDLPASPEQRLRVAHGAPGALLASGVRQSAIEDANLFLAAATSGDRAELLKVAFVQGHSGARGGFSDTLDALTLALYDRMRQKVDGSDEEGAGAASRAIDFVEEAKRLADGNVSPQLITARLLSDLSRTLS